MGKTNDDNLSKPLSRTSRLIGPEDLRPGQYVTVAEHTYQLLYTPDEYGCAGGVATEPRIARVVGWAEGAGWPLRVVEVCLPYAFAVNAQGTHVALDLRRHRLSRLSGAYGRAAFDAIKKAAASKT